MLQCKPSTKTKNVHGEDQHLTTLSQGSCSIVSHLSWRGVDGRQRTVADWTLPQTGASPNQWSWTTYSVSISSKSRFTYDFVSDLQNLHHTSHAHGNGDPHPRPQYSIATPATPWCPVSLTCTCVGVVGGCRNRGMEERMEGAELVLALVITWHTAVWICSGLSYAMGGSQTHHLHWGGRSGGLERDSGALHAREDLKMPRNSSTWMLWCSSRRNTAFACQS